MQPTRYRKLRSCDTCVKKLANFTDFRFLHVCVQSTQNFIFKIWEMVVKIKRDVNRLLLGSKFKKSLILAKYIENFLFIVSTISQILKKTFYVFWAQICRNWTKLFTWTYCFSQISHALMNHKFLKRSKI